MRWSRLYSARGGYPLAVVAVGVATALLLAFLAVDFGFVPPYYHLTVASPADWITLLVFLLVALSSGLQIGSIRQRERAAVQREREIALLSRLSSRLVSEESIEEMATFIVGEVAAVLG